MIILEKITFKSLPQIINLWNNYYKIYEIKLHRGCDKK